MAYFYEEPSRTFGEYLLVPGYSSAENVPTAVSLKTPLVKYRKGQEECPLQMNIPMISAIMQSVSGDKLAIALARQGGVSFIYGSQSIENEAAMVRRVKSFKAGYVVSDSNLAPTATLHDVLELKARTGHSTIAITADGTPNGKLLGIVASRDYRVNHTPDDAPVTTFMTPIEKLVTAPENTSLHDCNNIIWDNKINTLPLVDAEGNLVYMVFRKDYDSHKANVNELLDKNKSYVVGAGINTRDYAQRVPALVEAGVDVLCIDSSEGYSEWQSRTIGWIREHYGDTVKVGAGNVVDAEGFRFLAEAGADFVKIFASGAAANPSGKVEQSIMTPDEIRSAVEAAARKGSYVAAHCPADAAVRCCAENGVRTIEHATLMSERTLDAILAMGAQVRLVPTLAVMHIGDGPQKAYWQARLGPMFAHCTGIMQRAYQAGLKLGFGTDCAAGSYEYENGTEFRFRKENCHMKDIDILLQATVINAEIAGIDNVVGQIKNGMRANLILVDGKPDKDISAMYHRPCKVWKNGKLVRG